VLHTLRSWERHLRGQQWRHDRDFTIELNRRFNLREGDFLF
jgi:hypothetical protein